MKHFEHPLKHKPSELLWRMMLAFSVFLFVCGLVLSPWDTLLPGLAAIHRSPDVLISDYFIIGGMGATMLNAGLVTLASLLLTRRLGLTYSGLSVAAILIMGGFALFGKNLVNCLPILFGNWLFARYQEEKWNKYIVIGLFSTCLAPFVSFLYNALSTALWLRVAAAAGIGVVIGFVVPALAPHTASFHMGYNLFNVGFAAGFVAIALMSVLRGFQLDSGSVMIWQKGFPPLLTGLCLGALVLLFVWGWLLSDRELRRLGRITRHSGRAVADFVFMDGVGPTFMNMAVMGLLAIGWLWLVGGDLNGPTLGGVITIMGFAAFGMHPKNCAPIVAGIWAATLLLRYQPADPSIQLAALFGMGLAPIAGQFGVVWGIIAGMLHCAIVTTVGSVYGGLNLYNNGFTAGLVALILVPLIQSFKKET